MELKQAVEYLKKYNGRELRLMEVCGTHTAGIRRNGIPSVLSGRIKMVSGPGCPVCVTVCEYIDRLIELSHDNRNVIVSFADLLRVPGSGSDLSRAKAEGADIRFVYSPFEILQMAETETDRVFIFAAVGFETTTPVYAALIAEAENRNTDNIRLLTALKTMPQAIIRVAGQIDGFLAPGHVAVITGTAEYEELAVKLKRPFVVSGFRGEELAASIYALTRMAEDRECGCLNLYPHVVTRDGNQIARDKVKRYFEPGNAAWRGIGIIPASGMYLKKEFLKYDAGSIGLDRDTHVPGCRCPEVITGKVDPEECPLFGRGCTMEHPVGACMVSQEGACFIEYSETSGFAIQKEAVSKDDSKYGDG